MAFGELHHECTPATCPDCGIQQACSAEPHTCRDGARKVTADKTNNGFDLIACPVCEQRDPHCDYCGGDAAAGAGLVRIHCPRRLVNREVWDLVDAAEMVEKGGGWPQGGGWGLEPAALVDGVQRVWVEISKIKAALAEAAAERARR